MARDGNERQLEKIKPIFFFFFLSVIALRLVNLAKTVKELFFPFKKIV